MQARNIIAADAGGTSDPYVKVEFEGRIFKTGTRFKTLDPAWNEKFQYVTQATNQHAIVRMEVFDYDLVGSDDALGYCSFRVGDLTLNKAMSSWLPLKLREGEQPVGELHVELLMKKLPEFFVQTKPRSRSIDLSTPFVSLTTGMVVSPHGYTLERKLSMASTGIAFDFESTNPLISVDANLEEDELQIL